MFKAGWRFGSVRDAVRLCLMMLTALPILGRAASIDNTAFISFTQGGQTKTVSSTTVRVPIKERTPADIQFKAYANGTAGSTSYSIENTQFVQSGAGTGTMAPPELFENSIDLSSAVPLLNTGFYHSGAPVFVVLTDFDQNINPTIKESILVHISNDRTGDEETLLLKEYDPDSGIFAGYIQPTLTAASSYDGVISVVDNSKIRARYRDVFDAADVVATVAVINPSGYVFNAETGNPISGISIRLIDEATGPDAGVYAADGVTLISATVISDENGAYQFPAILPSEYRMEISLPPEYQISTRTIAELQAISGGPYELSEGSFGRVFTVGAAYIFNLDIPLDAAKDAAFIVKTASKEQMGIGEFIRYEITVENPTLIDILDAEIVDIQPGGFRYEKGSSYLDGNRVADPAISADGRELRYTLGTLASGVSHSIQYVARTGAGCKEGDAVNTAILQSVSSGSSFEATARVFVKDEMRTEATIIGRVAIDPNLQGMTETETPSSGQSNRWEGVAGVRIYMENGAYVITDKDGLYHIEGVTPGTHVLQIDKATLPDGLEAIAIENTRFAGRAFSQFIDVQEGTLWRADFPLSRIAPPDSVIHLTMNTQPLKDATGQVEIDIAGSEAPVGQLRVIVMVPKNAPVDVDTVTLDGVPVEIEQADNMLTFRLNESGTNWAHRIKLHVEPEDRAVTNDFKIMVMYDWGSQQNQRLPIHVHAAAWTKSETSNFAKTLPKQDASTVAPMEGVYETESKIFTPEWMETLDPGLGFVTPEEGGRPSMPAVHVGLKHGEKDSVTLSINGTDVSKKLYEGKMRNAARMLVVSQWRGIPLQDGWNELEAVFYDEEGTEIHRAVRKLYYAGIPVTLKLLKEQSVLVADGRTVPTVRVHFLDENGEPARAGIKGAYTVESPYVAYRVSRGMDNSLTVINRDKPSFTIGRDGIAALRLEPTSVSGEVVFNIPALGKTHEEVKAWMEAPLRDWIMVGFAEGGIGYNDLTENMEAVPDSEQDGYYDEGKVSFFAKGRVKGSFLMTVAYDTSKDTDPAGQNSLFQQIDPDTYYTLYADESQAGYEASSSEKLYLKIEKKTFYALFGDYETGLTMTELGKYSRSMTGFKSEYQGTHFKYNAFASDTGQGFMKDEIRGNGTSGLYTLSSGNLVYNSEKIVIETRDRYHNEQVLSSTPLARHTDYNIDYKTGELYFKKPIPSRDGALNLNYIVVDYEIDNGDEESWTYGGRAAVKTANDRVEIGVTSIQEDHLTDDRDELYAADAEIKLNLTTKLRGEVATSDVLDPVAGRQKGDAYLVELEHDAEHTSGRVYLREQSENFGLNQQSAGESATRKFGAEGSLKLNQKYRVNTEFYRQENLITDTLRDVVEAELEYRSDRFGVRAGGLYANDTMALGESHLSEQLHGGVTYQVWKDMVELRADRYQSIRDKNANIDFPTRTVLGLDYFLTDSIKLFTEYELADGEIGRSQNMRAGVESEPWQGGRVNTAFGQELNEYGPRTFSTLGLYQTYKVTEKWSVDAGIDMAKTINNGQERVYPELPPSSGDIEDFWAVSAGTGYEEALWSWVQRAEYLWSDTSERVSYVTGIMGQIQPRLSMSLSTAVFDQQGDQEDSFSADVRHGTAYRPVESDWVLLNRLDLIYDKREQGLSSEDSQRIVNQLNANYHPSRILQMSFRYGAKYIIDNFNDDKYGAFTDLYGWEMRYDISRKWDVGYRALALHGWTGHEVDWATGPTVGYNLAENMWMSLGYNFSGFYDQDFSASNYTAYGPYLRFRIKFDQETLGDLNAMLKSVVGR